LVVASVATAMLAPAASAQDTLQLVNYVANINNGSFFVGDANGLLNGTPIIMACVDSTVDVSFGQSWNVNIVSLSDPSALNGLLPGVTGTDFQADYILAMQFNGTLPNDADLDQAIWNFDQPSSFPLDVTQQNLQNAALAGVGSYNFGNAYMLLPDPSGSGQIFEFGEMTEIPEPATPWLAALFGAMALWISRIRTKRGQAAL
jgi:hypothetical protein